MTSHHQLRSELVTCELIRKGFLLGCKKSANRKESSFRAKLTFDDSRLTFAMFQCAKGVAYETPCYQGLAYSVEKHVW